MLTATRRLARVRIGQNIFVEGEVCGDKIRVPSAASSDETPDLCRLPADLDLVEVEGPPRENRPS